jgi:CheY-like chemotaxis protein
MSVSPDYPQLYKSFDYVPKRNLADDLPIGDIWGPGQILYLHIDVEDSGCGLTTNEKEALFEKFVQASPRTHSRYGGSGLGLFISRQLTELHGGQIGVLSEAGVGSTFSFFLQCKRISHGNDRPRRSSKHLERPPISRHHGSSNSIVLASPDLHFKTFKLDIPLSPSTREKLNILIVEDNLINQRVLSRQLIKAGCVVSTADNGHFALEHLTQTHFHKSKTFGLPLSIILMDWEMPEMNGLTCSKKIRQMQKDGELKAHVPILGVTANVRPEQIDTAIESGMDDILSKPFRVPELLEKIWEVLERLDVRGNFN